MGGDCDLVLANRRPVEAASDLVSANRDAAESPTGNSRRVPEPCASLVLRAREADRDTEQGGKQTTHASYGRFHGINNQFNHFKCDYLQYSLLYIHFDFIKNSICW